MIALVTGTSRGLGKTIVEVLNADGVFVRELHHEEFDQFLSNIHNTGNIDILVNNAGIYGPIGDFSGRSMIEWAKCIEVDLLFPVRLMQRVLPGMVKRGYGKIINISGGGATRGRPNFSAYSTAKTALVRFTETLAEEVKEYHIDVNAVAPGMMYSALTDRVIAAGPEVAGEKDYQEALACKERNIGPEKAAQLVAWLASHDSDGITGKLISVNDPWEAFSRNRGLVDGESYTLRRLT